VAQAMKLKDVLDEVEKNADDSELSVGQVVEALEYRGFGPLLLFSALITVLPTGAIPGVPTVSAILIMFIAGQLVVGRSHPWLRKSLT